MKTMKIDKICRACLRQDAEMIDTSEKDVYQKYLLCANLNAEEELLNITFNLCRSCEEKINVPSLDFKEECQLSHEILLYTRSFREIKLGADGANKPLRLEPFPKEEVSAEITKLKRGYYKHMHCIACAYVGKHSGLLIQHMLQKHKNSKPSWCVKCNAKVDDLPDHLATNHGDDYVCKFCGNKYLIRSELTEHLYYHFKKYQTMYKCYLCNKSYPRLYGLKVHWKKHKSDDDAADKQSFIARENFKCDRNVSSLLEHKETIHPSVDGNNTCTVCNKSFKSGSLLKLHLILHSTLYKCSYCNKNCKSKYDLVLHKRIHTGEKPYACQVCGRSFAAKSTLKGHMYLHNIGTKISCEICDKKFDRLYCLRRHIQSHTGEKPYVCAQCGKTFMQQSHLNVHLKIHTDVRPYQCNCCGKSFRTNHQLKQHKWTHSGEKPYKCSQCSYACRSCSGLSRHMNQHEVDKPQSEKPHVCLMCNRTFSTQATLASHINTHEVNFLDIPI